MLMEFLRKLSGVLIGLLLVLVVSVPSQAQISWVVADRDPSQIESLVGKLLPYVKDLPGQKEADAVILFNQLQTRVENNKAEMCRNLMVQVRDPENLVEHLVSPWVDSDIELTKLSAFVLHDGELRPIAEESLEIVTGAEGYGRSHCKIDWGKIEKGDIIGWSWVGKLEQTLPSLIFAVADVYPCVISNLTLDGEGKYVYDFQPVGFATKKLKLKEREIVQGEPSLWKASVNAMAAVDQIPVGPPYPTSVPHIAAALKKIWIAPTQGPVQPQWIQVGSWNTTATVGAGLLEGLVEDAGKAGILLSAVTTGATTEDEKIEAVYRHVQQKISTLEGPGVESLGFRDAKPLLGAKEVTPAEKALMMAVMLRQLDIPATVALVHTPGFGEFDEGREDWLQFDQIVVRTGDMEGGRFWVPQCEDCEAGTIPESWVGGTALVWPSDLLDLQQEFSKKQQKKAIDAGVFNISKMQREQAEQPWHKLVILGE